MGLYIKGMKPPNDCYECPCKKWVDDGCAGCWADSKIHNASKPIDCPLVEVEEPHGRLIDASYKVDMPFYDDEYEEYSVRTVTVEELLMMADNGVPTVIEAEGSDDA